MSEHEYDQPESIEDFGFDSAELIEGSSEVERQQRQADLEEREAERASRAAARRARRDKKDNFAAAAAGEQTAGPVNLKGGWSDLLDLMRTYKPFPLEESKAMILKYVETRDRELADKIARHHAQFVVKKIKVFLGAPDEKKRGGSKKGASMMVWETVRRNPEWLDEVTSVAWEKFLHALEVFDPNRGQGSFYATANWWMMQGIQRVATELLSGKKSRSAANDRRIKAAEEELQRQGIESPTYEQIAAFTLADAERKLIEKGLPITNDNLRENGALSVESIKQAREVDIAHHMSLDQPLGDGNDSTVAEILRSEDPSFEDAIANSEMREIYRRQTRYPDGVAMARGGSAAVAFNLAMGNTLVRDGFDFPTNPLSISEIAPLLGDATRSTTIKRIQDLQRTAQGEVAVKEEMVVNGTTREVQSVAVPAIAARRWERLAAHLGTSGAPAESAPEPKPAAEEAPRLRQAVVDVTQRRREIRARLQELEEKIREATDAMLEAMSLVDDGGSADAVVAARQALGALMSEKSTLESESESLSGPAPTGNAPAQAAPRVRV